MPTPRVLPILRPGALPIWTLALGVGLVGGLSGAPAAAQQSVQECEAMGDTLAAARGAYAANCPSLPRLDCDPVIGGWACASYRIGNDAPGLPPGGEVPVAGPASAPGTGSKVPGVVPGADGSRDIGMPGTPGIGECRWIDATLSSARAGFARMCTTEVRDCDPVPEGWMCSSTQIGEGSPGRSSMGGAVPDPVFVDAPDRVTTPDGAGGPGGLAPPPSPDGPTVPAASGYDGRFGNPSRSWADSYSADGVCYPDTNGDHGVYDLMVDTPAGRTTVGEALGRIASGPGIARAEALYNDIRCGRGPANDAGDEDRDQCPGRVDRGVAGCATVGPDWRFMD